MWIANKNKIDLVCLVDAWDGTFAAAGVKKLPDIVRAGYVLGERQTHNEKSLVNAAEDEPLNQSSLIRKLYLDRLAEARATTAVAIQFYTIGVENSGATQNTPRQTQRTAVAERYPTRFQKR